MFGAFSIYFHVQDRTPASLGMADVRTFLALTAAVVALCGVAGMFVATENSRILAKIVLQLEAVPHMFRQLVFHDTHCGNCDGDLCGSLLDLAGRTAKLAIAHGLEHGSRADPSGH